MSNAQRAVRFLVLSTLLLLASPPARADWLADGVLLAAAAQGGVRSVAISDNAGGAIVVWRDVRNGNNDIYAQRIDAFGNLLWGAGGVGVCTAIGSQDYPSLVADGAGGAIISWHDLRGANIDIYAQRITGVGSPMWTANGVAVCAATANQFYPKIVTDGIGGAIITWMDFRLANYDIYAQRVSALGGVQWLANGVEICNAVFDQYNPAIVADGAGGAIIAWHDIRNGIHEDIYAQRVQASGMTSWAGNGVALCTATNTQGYPSIVSDFAGGAIVAWADARSGDFDIFAQRVDATGLTNWGGNGVSITSAAGSQGGYFAPSMVADGAGGVILTWHDSRDGLANHIYAQRMSQFGTPLWAIDGVPVCLASEAQGFPTLIPTGNGGAVVAWHTALNGFLNVHAQLLDASGVSQWTTNGVELAPAPGSQQEPKIVHGGAGAAIVAWDDSRAGIGRMFAQRIETRHGFWGYPEPNVDLVADIPNDQGGKVKVNWDASDHDAVDSQAITHYSIWRATDQAAAQAAAAQGNAVERPSEVTRDFMGRAVWIEPSPPTEYYWEWVGNQDAHYREAYTFSASTRSDSTVQDDADAYFFVSAHTADRFVFFDSNVGSGHSVDNLAPLAPLGLIAQRVGNDVHLRWNRVLVPDLRDYSVYRASSTGVTPVPMNFLAASDDTVLVDGAAPANALYYIVTATDVHANQGAASNEANVGATTGIGNTPAITTLTVRQNYPNPFTGSTDLSIGLPRESDISIEIYDVAGRLVRNEQRARLSAGWQRVSLSDRGNDGKPLASGVYFYRVSASGSTITKKMVITR